MRISSVAVGVQIGVECRETMQVRKARAIGVDGEHRAIAISAAICAVPYRVLPDKINPASRISSVAVGTGIE